MDDLHNPHAGSQGGRAQRSVVPLRQDQLLPAQRYDFEPPEPEQTDLFQPRAFLEMLLRRSWLIAGVAALVIALGAASTLLQTPIYEASATIEVKRQETRILEEGQVNPSVVADSEHMQTQYALLKSRALAERVAETLDLPSDPNYAVQTASRADRLASATEKLERGLDVRPVQRSRVIEIIFKSPYPEDAARIATAFAENYIQNDLERRYNATAYARTFLEERLQSTKAALEDSERKLVAYSREKQIIDLSKSGGADNGASLDASALIALNNALTSAQQDRISAEQKFIAARDNPSARTALTSDVIKSLNDARAKLTTEYQEKLRTYKPDFPEMRDLAARIEATDKEIIAEQGRITAGLESAFKAAQAQENALQVRVNELKGQVQDVQTRSIDYNILQREVDTQRSQYNALLQRFKEVSIVSGISESQVSIVDRAQVPGAPSSPNLRSDLIRYIFFGLLLAIAIAMLVEYVDDTIKTPDDVKDKLELPLIAVVPKVEARQTILEALEDTKSSVAEAFGSARTALQFTTASGAPRTLLVTGNRPSEGKTSTVTGLALAFAGIGKRVLIIDADLRRPSFVAGPDSSIGLSGLLTHAGGLADAVVTGDAANVYLLPSGGLPPNPADLLSTARMGQLLQDASAQYDIVIVDAPPVLDFADAPILSSICEATLLVVQSSGARRPIVLRTIERLVSANANIIGVALTKFNLKRAGYGYAYNYGYQYGGYRSDTNALEREVRDKRKVALFSPRGQTDRRT